MRHTRSQVIAWVVLGVIGATVLVAAQRHDVARLGGAVLGAVTTATAAA